VGVLLAGAADMVVAAAGTRFVLAEIDNGATAGGVLAMRLMPEMRVRAAMMTADPVLAEELHAYGSIYRVTPLPELAQVARDLAAKIAAKNAGAMRRLKRSLNNSARAHDVETAYRAETSYTYELNIMGVASAGRTAFIAGDRASYMAGESVVPEVAPSANSE
jgi:enoyl-CoA hydratase